MIDAPGNTGAASLRDAEPSEADAIQAVLDASSAYDDPAGWTHGAWSLSTWATGTRVLVVDGRLVGVVAVRAETAPDGAMPVRVALDMAARRGSLPALLVQGGVDLVRESGGNLARLFLPSHVEWARAAAGAGGFAPVRTIAHMLMPASAATPPSSLEQPGFRLRSIRSGEDQRVLAALNRAWAGTWNFVAITFEMLERDLVGQRDGMLLGVELDAPDHIIATCHAVFAPGEQNPDGNPRAWISNLTVDPDYRGRGISRAMLGAGIEHLRSRGAASISLGVDADNPAPFRLYQSVGFEVSSSLEAWDKGLA